MRWDGTPNRSMKLPEPRAKMKLQSGGDVPSPAVFVITSAPVKPKSVDKAMSVRGHLDGADEETAFGWASDGSGRTLTVRILVDDIAVGECTADLDRPDVAASGQHPSGRCGFRFAHGLRNAARTARVAAFAEGPALPGSGMFLKPAQGAKLFFICICTPRTAGGALEHAASQICERSVVQFQDREWHEVSIWQRFNFVSARVDFEDALARYSDRGFRFFTGRPHAG